MMTVHLVLNISRIAVGKQDYRYDDSSSCALLKIHLALILHHLSLLPYIESVLYFALG